MITTPDRSSSLCPPACPAAARAAASGIVAPSPWLTACDDGTWRLLGRPRLVSDKMSALGTNGELAFVDLWFYLVGDRALMEIDVSAHHQFAMDVSVIRVRLRVDGRIWLQNPVTPADGDPAVSPVVLN